MNPFISLSRGRPGVDPHVTVHADAHLYRRRHIDKLHAHWESLDKANLINLAAIQASGRADT